MSIIVAARGRHSATRTCVVSLLALDYAFDRREIIVVDDASEPPLAAALAGLPIRLIRLDRNIGQSAARNLAAAEAQGELLAFTDNDCIADPAWLRSLVPYFDDPSVAIVGGRVNAPPPTGTVAAFEAVRSPLDMGAIGSTVGPEEAVSYLPTCNFIVRRDTFLAAAGFDAEMRLGEDVDFTWRVLRTGARACYVPLAHVTHHHRERLGPLLRRRADYASSEADLQHRHPSGRRVMPMPRTSLLVLATLTALPLSAPPGRTRSAGRDAGDPRGRRKAPPDPRTRDGSTGIAHRAGGGAGTRGVDVRPERECHPLLRHAAAGPRRLAAGPDAGDRHPVRARAREGLLPAEARLWPSGVYRPLLAGNGRLPARCLARLPRSLDAASPIADTALEKVIILSVEKETVCCDGAEQNSQSCANQMILSLPTSRPTNRSRTLCATNPWTASPSPTPTTSPIPPT
ncbi:MAG: mycofactocin biosynthesis glycosyltransferase MftF [Rhodospirillales bacterium]|nr:mycofactocin biosynthesis glycosyltransferase MftF [Rhodospirillales bacterium]